MNTQDNNGIRKKKTDNRKLPLIDCEVRLYSFFTATCLITIVKPLLNGHLGDRRSGRCREV